MGLLEFAGKPFLFHGSDCGFSRIRQNSLKSGGWVCQRRAPTAAEDHDRGLPMLRRLTWGLLAVAWLTTTLGCRNSCGERRGFGLCNWNRSDCSEGGLFSGLHRGRTSGRDCPGEVVYAGQLVSFPGSSGVPLTPAPNTPLPNELPMPQPSDLIPRQPVPFAPPSSAPAPGEGSTTSAPANPRK